jgi:hypothetical protein
MTFTKSRNPMIEEEAEMESVDQDKKCCRKGGKVFPLIAAILVVIILACGAWLGVKMLLSDSIAQVSGKEWQAIFLSNGQVYFGKVKAVGTKTVTLADIYYLQVVTKPLQRTQEGATAAAAQTQQELTLIKLGNEIHGPTDHMVINRDQVLLSEILKNDSRVVQAITKYVSDQKAAEQKK